MGNNSKEEATQANQAVMKGISDLQRRLRVLEERYTTLRRKGQLIDENFLDTERELRAKVKKLDQEHTDVRRMIVDLDDKLDRFLEQVKKAAPREDVLVLKKYLDMWDPVKYLTRQEATRLLERNTTHAHEPIISHKKMNELLKEHNVRDEDHVEQILEQYSREESETSK